MIPYDDLVAALSAWRARQGLPVSTMGGAVPAPSTGSGPVRTAPPGPPPRSTPPTPPPRNSPPPLAPGDELDVDEAALLEDGDAGDYAMAFGNDDETAVGTAPGGTTPGATTPGTTRPGPPQTKRGRNDW